MHRLFALLKGSTEGASIGDDVLLSMMGAATGVVIHISAEGGIRQVGEVWFADDAARRGEIDADLLKTT
jgi:type IV secretion system protein VirB11